VRLCAALPAGIESGLACPLPAGVAPFGPGGGLAPALLCHPCLLPGPGWLGLDRALSDAGHLGAPPIPDSVGKENGGHEEVIGPSLYRSPKDDAERSDSSGRVRRSHPVLSQAWPGEEKHELVEQCYQQFRQALLRYDPPPLELKTPETFFYHDQDTLNYRGSIPVLPEAYLNAHKIGELRPMLAAHLYWYNLEILAPGGAADSSPGSFLWEALFLLTGNWLWLPSELCQSIASELGQLSTSQYRGLVLEADAFAVLLGQGPELERQLREVQRVMRARHMVEEHAPTLSERIGHLEALNKRERAEMRALGLNVKEPRKLPPPEPPWPQLR
jgi:hypothetical protein